MQGRDMKVGMRVRLVDRTLVGIAQAKKGFLEGTVRRVDGDRFYFQESNDREPSSTYSRTPHFYEPVEESRPAMTTKTADWSNTPLHACASSSSWAYWLEQAQRVSSSYTIKVDEEQWGQIALLTDSPVGATTIRVALGSDSEAFFHRPAAPKPGPELPASHWPVRIPTPDLSYAKIAEKYRKSSYVDFAIADPRGVSEPALTHKVATKQQLALDAEFLSALTVLEARARTARTSFGTARSSAGHKPGGFEHRVLESDVEHLRELLGKA